MTKLFIKGRKWIAFITKSCFTVSKTIMLNSTLYFVIKIPKYESFNKLQLIISQILPLKVLCIFKKKCCKDLLKIIWDLDVIFLKEYEN